MTEKIIELEDVTVAYGNQTALENVTLSVDKGDVVGVVGPNGGGKTTLMNTILGNVPAVKGKVRLFGEDLHRFKDFHRIGYVSQSAIQFDPLFPATVRELVSLGCISRRNLGRRLSKDDWAAVDRAIEMVDLDGLQDRKISQLSGGQKQRIFIAKALVRRPELLLLDEATAGLDVCIQDKFINLVRQLKQEMDVTVITVSHDLSGVICQANRLFVVNRRVWTENITAGTDPTKTLRQAYGQHFTFMYHSHDHYPIPIEEPKEEMK